MPAASGLEGIVSKRVDLPYRAGRGDHWLKTKVRRCGRSSSSLGYVPSTAAKARRRLAAARLPRRRQAALCGPRRHRLFGRSGDGAAHRARQDRGREAQARQRAAGRRREGRALGSSRSWSREIEFRGWTADGWSARPRSRDCARTSSADEVMLEIPRREDRQSRAHAGRRAPRRLTHPERILWDDAGHHQAGPRRILHRHRGLDPAAHQGPACSAWCAARRGVGGEMLLRQACLGRARARRVQRHRRRREGADAGASTASRGCSSWCRRACWRFTRGARTSTRLEQPDRLIFDLDPGEGVHMERRDRGGARGARRSSTYDGLASFVKTTGGKGLHVVRAAHAARRLGRGQGLHPGGCRAHGQGAARSATSPP